MTTQLLILENILWLPLCRINKFGLNTLPSKTLAIPYTCGLSGVPRLACLRPTMWLHSRPSTARLHQRTLKTLTRGQASRAGRHKTSSGVASPGWLARGREIKARGTSRGSCDVIHDERHQAGASARSVLVSSLVLRRPAQARSTEASCKGCYISATRPGPGGRQDGGHRGAQDGVTTRAFRRRRPLLSG